MASLPEIFNTFSQNQYKFITVGDEWSQGRTLFGGLAGALLYRLARQAVSEERLIRNIQITFVGPLIPDEIIEFECTVLRQGGSITSIECKAIQDGKVKTNFVGCFGKDRESTHVAKPYYPAPNFTSSQASEKQIQTGIPVPKFLQFYDLTWVRGSLPASGDQTPEMGGLIKIRDYDQLIDESIIISLLDAWPPIALQSLDHMAPASTLSWNIQFFQTIPELPPNSNFQYLVNAYQGEHGYSFSGSQLWTQDGHLLAITQQSDVVYG